MRAMKIHELLDRDPLQVRLANNGQARITGGEDPKVMQELREELETFVCRGKFADALQRILERYLANLDASRQDAVWVSGFFGSGKSHLLKMLAHLWVNTKFEDGVTARGLVGARLPPEVRDALRELDTRARRIGKAARQPRRVRFSEAMSDTSASRCLAFFSGLVDCRNSIRRPGSACGCETTTFWNACAGWSKLREDPGRAS